MKHQLLKLTALFVILISVSCNSERNSYEQITALRTTQDRIKNLHKSFQEIIVYEDSDALTRSSATLLEYDFPIRENESYTISYRFKESICYQIGLNTYFNSQNEARKVINGISKELNTSGNYTLTGKGADYLLWNNTKNATTVKINTQHIERGTVFIIVISIE